MLSQWQCLQQNLGIWHGAFRQFSPDSELVKETPSVLTLEETEPGQTMELTLERTPAEEDKQVNHITFTAPGPAPATYFFESGTFSQGSAQWSSFGQFITEFSLNADQRRVRFVVAYQSTQRYTSAIKYVTLICETQPDGPTFTEGPLTLAALSGDSQGTVDSLSVVTREFGKGTSDWSLADGRLVCKEQFDQSSWLLTLEQQAKETDATGNGAIAFRALSEDEPDYQLMLLPDGAYCFLPIEIAQGQAFRVEVGWQRANRHRTRLIRYYDERGVWLHSALVEDAP